MRKIYLHSFNIRNAAFFSIFFFALLFSAAAQDLNLTPDDLHIELRADGGYHLFIRAKPDISSVLILESTADATFTTENYAYRALERNEINGDEIRLLNGQPLPSGLNSLVSSTAVWHPVLGWSFHIYIPTVLAYGYEGARNGLLEVGDGTYFNIRTFYYAYADYRGAFADNPFILRISQETQSPARGRFLPQTIDEFTRLSGVRTRFAGNPGIMLANLREILEAERGNNVDIAIVLDVTASMRPYYAEIRENLFPQLENMIRNFSSFRISLVFFKDYRDEFLNKVFPFTTDFNLLRANMDTITVGGGGDVPEAVHEAIYAASTELDWSADKRIMILIGDAPPHPRPRGRITRQMVERELAAKEIEMHSIVLPHP